MKRGFVVPAVALAFVPLLSSAGAAAQGGFGSSFDAGQAREEVEKGRTVPLAKIRQTLQSRYGGSMSDANLYSKPNGTSEYSIKWIDRDGQRLIVKVDAQTGRVIRESRG